MTCGAVEGNERGAKAPVFLYFFLLSFLSKSNLPTKRFLPATSTSDMGRELNTVEFSLMLKLMAVRGKR